MKNNDRTLPKSLTKDSNITSQEDNEDEDNEAEGETKVLEEVADFSSLMVWGHERAPDEKEDSIARGINEWIGFAEAVSLTPGTLDFANTENRVDAQLRRTFKRRCTDKSSFSVMIDELKGPKTYRNSIYN